MIYKLQNGELVEADNLRQLAEKIWQGKFDPEPTIELWMVGSARRAAMYDGSVLRTSSPEDHVADMIQAGFVSRV